MPETREVQQMILAELRLLHKELREHMTINQADHDGIKERVNEQRTLVALTRQRLTWISGGIAVAVSVVISFFVNHLLGKQ
jgi:hypothetical protein